MERKVYKSLDILKIISAISIVGLHCFRFNIPLYDYWFNCMTRFGVPCFFIISSFLLFKKNPDWNNMKQFAKRIGQLYLFWLITTSPLTIYGRFIANHSLSLGEKLVNFVHTSIWSVSFSGSWYLMVLLQSVFIVYFLKKHLSNYLILFIGFILYILPCIAASYDYLFSKDSLVINFISTFTTIFFRPYHCFPAGIIFVSIGMLMAEKESQILKYINKSNKGEILLCLSIFLCFIENYIIYIYSKGLRTASDAFFSLIPLSASMILIALKLDATHSIKFSTVTIRNISTIMYFSQFTFIFILNKLQRQGFLPISNLILYLLVIACTIALTHILLYLQREYSKTNFLKYAF